MVEKYSHFSSVSAVYFRHIDHLCSPYINQYHDSFREKLYFLNPNEYNKSQTTLALTTDILLEAVSELRYGEGEAICSDDPVKPWHIRNPNDFHDFLIWQEDIQSHKETNSPSNDDSPGPFLSSVPPAETFSLGFIKRRYERLVPPPSKVFPHPDFVEFDLPSRAVQQRKRLELPMNILGSTFATCPDSGSEENIMSRDVTLHLGLAIEDSIDNQKEFRMANGKIVKALGRTSVTCAFAKDPSTQNHCWFYVFQSMITPVIMGMAFLRASETLTKYKYRLHCSTIPHNIPLQLSTLNNPVQRLRCWADRQTMLAHADTGSEVDLISLAYAMRKGYPMEKLGFLDNKVQFADGTYAFLAGMVHISISLKYCQTLQELRAMQCIEHKFYVLSGLTSDMLFGEEFLNEHDAFDTYDTGFVTEESADVCSQVNTIVWFKGPERILARSFGRESIAAPYPLSGIDHLSVSETPCADV